MPSVADTPELRRVLSLPRRQAAPDLSPQLRRNPGVSLFYEQNQFLHDAPLMRGGVGDIEMGRGKSLLSLLLPVVFGSVKPLLILPGGEDMRAKLRRECAEYSKDWHVRMPELVSYTALAREDRDGFLEWGNYDLVIADEAQALRNVGASCTRRVARYLANNPAPFLPLSGTLWGTRLTDAHHLVRWALGTQAMPLPQSYDECREWSLAVDGADRQGEKYHEGALISVPGGPWSWMRGSMGLVVSEPDEKCGAEIHAGVFRPAIPPELQKVIDRTKETGYRPDGEELDDSELARCISTLELGFFHIWNPLPPEWWMEPRKRWFAEARDWLSKHLPGLDSKGQLENAMLSNKIPKSDALTQWLSVRDLFKENPEAVWITKDIMRQVAEYAGRRPGTLVWSLYDAPGQALGRYYGPGTDPRGAPFETICLSLRSHGKGKNLQHKFRHHLFLDTPGSEEIVQQAIARTHRTGLTAGYIDVEFLAGTPHNEQKVRRLRNAAKEAAKRLECDRKLSIARWRN